MTSPRCPAADLAGFAAAFHATVVAWERAIAAALHTSTAASSEARCAAALTRSANVTHTVTKPSRIDAGRVELAIRG